MKKFNIKGVLDGIRGGSINQPSRPESEVEEILRPEHFQVAKTVRHGFPHQPTALAYDPVQKILAVGTKTGSLRIFGRPGVDSHVRHETDDAVIQILFLINEGYLVTVCAGDSLHKWDLRQKIPEIQSTLKFQRERITCCELPFKSRWLYIGTERGNVHVVNIETLNLSGYVINWNKAIELSRKTHPGPVVHLSDNPVDPNKLLIGFESGSVALWDLRNKSADARYQNTEPLKSISWHHEGKQFMCSHSDGSLTTWSIRASPKPISVLYPHAKTQKDGKLEPCKPINKVEWKSHRAGDSFIIFSGGLTYDRAGRTPCITVIHGKTTTVLEMEHNVVDFISLCETPWQSDYQNPHAIVVLLHNDLVVVDLTTSGYSCFENPYPMDLHESAVTCCFYLAVCPADLIPALYSVGSKSFKRSGFSEKEWPINGGAWSLTSCSYAEVIITGHADGSLKFWDASAVSLQILYKLKTAKVFEKPKSKSFDGQDEDPFAIHHISLCPESRILCIAGASSHVMLFRFSKQESLTETSFIEIPIQHEIDDELECSPECEYPPRPFFQQGTSASCTGEEAARRSKIGGSHESSVEYHYPLRVKVGPQKRPAGYQPDLVCLTPWVNGEIPGHITSVGINSSYGLLAYGNETGLVIVDIIQKTCLLNMGTPDLYGSSDPYQRIPRSPKRNQSDNNYCDQGERCRSPTSVDQINGVCLSPTTGKQQRKPHTPEMKRTKSQDKIDSSFSRSRSSSMSSLENITSEAIQCLVFSDSFSRKTDTGVCPTLWVGTSLGSVLVIMVNLPPTAELRQTQPVIVSPSGTIFRLKGAIQCLAFLDWAGTLVPYAYESWKDPTKEAKGDRERDKSAIAAAPEFRDRQFVVIASEKQARVIALPSQTCAYKAQVTDSSFIVKVDIMNLKESICLACYIANGHIAIFSLPSLRILLDVEFVPLIDLSCQTSEQGAVDPMISIWGKQLYHSCESDQTARTFCFSAYGHGMYLCSPCEVQKFTVLAEFCENFEEMLGDLYQPATTPEPPKEGFFKGLFGAGVRSLDREELFGDASGKPSRSIARHISPQTQNLENLGNKATGVASEISRAHKAAVERGEHLGKLEDTSNLMMVQAENFYHESQQLKNKYKDRKWYQF